MKHKADNGIDAEMRKFCKECVSKKHDSGTVIYLKVEYFSDANNNGVEISNEIHNMLYCNYNEGNMKITN